VAEGTRPPPILQPGAGFVDNLIALAYIPGRDPGWQQRKSRQKQPPSTLRVVDDGGTWSLFSNAEDLSRRAREADAATVSERRSKNA